MICTLFFRYYDIMMYIKLYVEEGMSKYEPLWKYLREKKKDNYRLTYSDIKGILGFEIDHSFLTYKKELKEYGYEVERILMKEKVILFKKI